ncbi:MAG TPA: cytochrome P450 [Thermoanaerobaculia bacterium]|nr:cytochrome P450 [Thermoanaerobaculia bacterium]
MNPASSPLQGAFSSSPGLDARAAARRLRGSLHWLKNPYAVLDEARKRHGLTFWLDLSLIGRTFVTGDPMLIQELTGHPELDAGRGIAALREVMGDRSMITLDGEDHAARRRIVAPLFGREIERLDEMTARVTAEALGEIPVGSQFSLYGLARRISLRLIVRLVFGESERAERLVDDFLLSFESPWVLFLKPLQIDLGPFSPWGRTLRNRRRLREYLLERIAQCRRGTAPDAGLARIVREGPELADDEIATEVLALLLFGHDTGAATLAWAFAHLHQHPGAVALAREEPAYLKACLEESMRLCPVVVHVTRVARCGLRIGGHDIPAGTRIFPSAYLAQRNPEVFQEPERFRPERFLAGRAYEGSYFPFGFSPRTCIGRHFVMRQMILTTSAILRRAELSLAPGYETRPERRLVLILPRRGTRMVLERRREAA